jgi:3-hydroxyisobutyrate dehydrogenase-like beta-hydroxyacid dehydrogenase
MNRGNTIGFIGLGRMGFPMLTNLQKKFKVCTFDTNKTTLAKTSSLDNVTNLNSFMDFKNVTAIFLMLPSDEVVKEACLGNGGLIKNLPKDSNIFDCSTVSLQTSNSIYNIAKENNVNYIDCPVSGGFF